MRDKNEIPFTAPAKTDSTESDVKISIIELPAGEEQKPDRDFERIQMAIKSLNAGIWTLDISTNSLTVCDRCKEISSIWNEKSVKISTLRDLIAAGYGNKVVEAVLLALSTRSPFDLEVPIVDVKAPRHKWLRITGAATCSNKNSTFVIHGLIEDISDRKNGEFFKQDLPGVVSHDLRSPLSVIKLYIQLCSQMAGNIGNNYISEKLKKAELQVHKMNRMIQCYLESSMVNAEKISHFPVAFDIKELLQEVIGDLCLINPCHIIFLKPGRCVRVFADRDKIGQVLQNLLGNAIKYSLPMDVITVHLKKVGHYVQVTVKDHGIGVKAADQERIFDRFYRAGGECEKTAEGYGIGLYLTKEIIKQHNGHIWIESEVDRGSKFYFTLPLS